jgi:4-hydroxyphenylpyruvate dioxygenase
MDCLGIDCLHFYVDDVEHWQDRFCRVWNFTRRGHRYTDDTLSIWLGQGTIQLVFSQALRGKGPVAAYRRQHPQGVAEVVFQVASVSQAAIALHHRGIPFDWLENRASTDSTAISPCLTFATPFGIRHTLVERLAPGVATSTPGFAIANQPPETLTAGNSQPDSAPLFSHVDHIVLNVGPDRLMAAANWYREVLGLDCLYRYTIQTPTSGLRSIVMGRRNPPGEIAQNHRHLQLPINEPTNPQSQIQEFVTLNGGAGIQHVALYTPNILSAVTTLRQRGVSFLDIPPSYYDTLPPYPSVQKLRSQFQACGLLLDAETPTNLLLQTFTQPTFETPTFFFELIQRQERSLGFGEGNFQALFEAIEREQLRRQGCT